MKFKFIYVKNDVFRQLEKQEPIDVDLSCAETGTEGLNFLNLLRAQKRDITEKRFDHISSFNFNRDVFMKNNWTELSKIARGLFLNTNTGDIVARGFEKFFNYSEGMFNTDSWLKENLKFPVTAYKKYNGFLGILSFDKETKSFLFCSKSCVSGMYTNFFKDVFYELKDKDDTEYLTKLADHLVKNNTCLVFEVIDPKNDPHIVYYDHNDIVLLAEIKLTKNFEQTKYEDLCKLGEEFGFKTKEKIATFLDWDTLKSFLAEAEDYDLFKNEEGWVLEDANGYNFKLKCGWYRFWKSMRHYKQKLQAGHQVSTSGLTTPRMNKVFAFMKNKSRDWLEERSIVDVRKEYEKENIND